MFSGCRSVGWWAALAALVGCDDHVIGRAPPPGQGCDREPPLTYENTGDGLLDRHCTTCHTEFKRAGQRGGAPLDVNLNTWDDVLLWADRIQVRTIEQQTMPPTGTMIQLERDLLEEWLKCEVFPALGQAPVAETTGGES